MKKYGYFSSKAKSQYGSVIWKSITGENVEVTGVALDNDYSTYLWDDAICVGEVLHYVSGCKTTDGEEKWNY